MSKKRRKNKKYSSEIKIAAVKSYLAGEGSQVQICKKFGILRHRQLQEWIKCYNGHKDFKERSSAKGEIYILNYNNKLSIFRVRTSQMVRTIRIFF